MPTSCPFGWTDGKTTAPSCRATVSRLFDYVVAPNTALPLRTTDRARRARRTDDGFVTETPAEALKYAFIGVRFRELRGHSAPGQRPAPRMSTRPMRPYAAQLFVVAAQLHPSGRDLLLCLHGDSLRDRRLRPGVDRADRAEHLFVVHG
ncbi:MAG: hypothetical protein R2838_19880 [Caldilineaceae bacterium]